MVIVGDPGAVSGARESRNYSEKSQPRKTWGFYLTIFFTKFSPHHFDFPLPPLTAWDLKEAPWLDKFVNHSYTKNALEWQEK